MKYAVAALLAAISAVQAKVALTNTGADFADVEAGDQFDITWSGNDGPVTLTLKQGPSGDLHDVMTLASGLTGDSWVWNVSPSTVEGQYAIQIADSSDVNYSVQFQISSDNEGSSSSSSSSSSAPSSTMAPTSSSPSSSTPPPSTTTSGSSTASSTASSTTSGSDSTMTTPTGSSSSKPTPTSDKPTKSSGAPENTDVPDNGAISGFAAPLAAPFMAAIAAALF